MSLTETASPVNQTEGDQIHFSLNDYSQYHKWAFLMKGLLDDHGEWNESANLPTEGKAGFRLIVKNVHQNSIDLIMDTTSSVEAWEILAREFAGTSIPTQRATLKELLNFKIDSNIHSEIKRIKELKRLLVSSLGNNKEIAVDHLVAVCFLEALPESFSGTKAILENQETITLDEICTKVNRAPIGFKESGSVANKASTKRKCNHEKYSEEKCWFCHPELRPVCSDCKEKGLRFYHQKDSKICSNKAIQAYSCLSLRTNSSRSTKFIIDSGCSDHMVQNGKILLNSKSSSLPINTASGEQLRSSAVGDVVVYNEEHPNVLLKDVIGCPKLGYNLLSVSKMVKNGHIVMFDDEGAYAVERKHMPSNLLKSTKNNAFISGMLKNELFEFHLPNQTQIAANTTNMSKGNFSRWHQRLGHLNYNDMKLLEQKCDGMTLIGSSDECETCIISKSKRKNYPSSANRAKRAGEIIHFDVGVINFVSVQGNKYYILFVDDFSRYNTLYCIKKKSDCESIIKGHVSLVANKFSKAPLIVRSDNAKEFFTNELNDYFFKTESFTNHHATILTSRLG